MLSKPDDSSFVTWADVFHPETGEAFLAPHVREHHGNSWGAVLAEATLVEDKEASASSVTIDEETGDAVPDAVVVPDPSGNPLYAEPLAQADASSPWRGGRFIDTLIAGALTVAAVTSTCSMELAATIVYAIACGFYHIFTFLQGFNVRLLTFLASVLLPVVACLLFADAVVLITSVLVTELIAGISFMVCALFGGAKAASNWHQYIRKLCHLSRWAFRDFHKGWKPKRILAKDAESEPTGKSVAQSASQDSVSVEKDYKMEAQ